MGLGAGVRGDALQIGSARAMEAGLVMPSTNASGNGARAGAQPLGGISDASVDRSIQRIEQPQVQERVGGEQLGGNILTLDGQPLGGVVLVARDASRKPASVEDTRAVGTGVPDDDSLDATLRKAAESWGRAREGRQRTESRPDGSYGFEGLVAGTYRVKAYKVGWSIEAIAGETALTGETLNFLAQPYHEVELDVRLPDGSQPSEALIILSGEGSGMQPWTPAAPRIKTSKRRVTVDVRSGMLDHPSNKGLSSRYGAEGVFLDVTDTQTSHEVQLEERLALVGRLFDPWNPGSNERVRLLRIPVGQSYEDKKLAESDNAFRTRDGRFGFFDLDPGSYAVGVRGTGETVRVYELVDISEGLVEVDLHLQEPEAADHIVARCLAPDGVPLDSIQFRAVTRTGERERSNTLSAKRAPDGSWWLPWAGFQPKVEDWAGDTRAVVIAESREYGQCEVPVSQGESELLFSFPDPCKLCVRIAGYVGHPHSEGLGIRVVQAGENGRTLASSGSGRRGRGGSRLDSTGEVTFHALPPGSFEVLLTYSMQWSQATLSTTPVQLSGGLETLELASVPLHELRVHAPNSKGGEGLWVSPKEGGSFGMYKELGEDQRATFDGVPAGAYSLTLNGSQAIEVTVPCGEVTYDPPKHDCLRVAISDDQGLLYLAGFRVGDEVIGFDGTLLVNAENLWGYWTALGKGEVSFSVVRGGSTQTIRLGPISNSERQNLGGSLNAGFRR